MTDAPNPHYTIEKSETVVATDQLRAKRLTLAPGQEIPWHYHSAITDWFFCLEGTLRVETRAPRSEHVLPIGGSCQVPARTAHRVSNAGTERCQFLILQGVGTYDYVPVGGAS